MKRKTLTLSRDFFEKVNGFDEQIKHAVYDAVFDLFFNNKNIEYDNFDAVTRTALACLVPDLRRVQTQFDNGRVAKKLRLNSQGIFCPSEASQMMPNEANLSHPDSSILNNNNINNNIYNINNNQSTQSSSVRENYTRLMEKINTLKLSQGNDEQIIARAEDLFQRVAKEKESPVINGQPVAVADVLVRYLQIFENKSEEDSIKILKNIFDVLDQTCQAKKITNSYRYLISLFYNSSLQQVPKTLEHTRYMQHSYSASEINDVFDSLDDLE